MTVRRALLFDTGDTCPNSVIDAGLIFMNEHYDRDISLGELASLCHISPQHFCRVFRLETGMRPMEYLTQKRMLEAKVLLCDTSQSIAEISRQTGYEDPAYFGMVFKKHEGISPSQYRRTKASVINYDGIRCSGTACRKQCSGYTEGKYNRGRRPDPD